ncbi:E3 ubiquitin-protein ligase SIRP1-like [Durio zibethinus]|uniref:RING-type E3 ubiquitin transferase n=1 Tax=Durio zibethinus TaxID=66656 RepID=A0A6P5Y5F3_DURZI|nr:E3 ubiquitin-protein ligase SIRP1-like [Durio zibethinus]
MLNGLRINPESLTFDLVIDEIIRHGLRIGNLASNMGRKVLPLRLELWGTVEEHVNNDMILVRRALEESALESNYGMVPAKESSVEKMLKRVRVEDGDEREKGEENIKKRKVKGEDCVICLEEIKVGSGASRMPCSHTFHAICIETWLKQSHYCPICRFEMPTES